MIFVTVGSSVGGFDRLLLATSQAAAEGCFGKEEVLVQSRAIPRGIEKAFRVIAFIEREEFDRNLREASLVISHGGSTLISAARTGKVPIAMPRRRDLGELLNDHQVRFVAALARQGIVIPAYEAEDLPRAIGRARESSAPEIPKGGGASAVAEAVRVLASSRRFGR